MAEVVQRRNDKRYRGRPDLYARLGDDVALARIVAAAYTIAQRHYQILIQLYPDDFEGIVSLIAVEATRLGLKDGRLLSFINKSLYHSFRSYGFASRKVGEVKAVPNLDDRRAFTVTPFTYERPRSKRKHLVCKVPKCYATTRGGSDERYGWLCQRHWNLVRHRKLEGFPDPYEGFEDGAAGEEKVCGVHGCDAFLVISGRVHKRGIHPDRKTFCKKHYELFRQRRKAGWDNPYKGTPLKLGLFAESTSTEGSTTAR